jgi:hypothetical protein
VQSSIVSPESDCEEDSSPEPAPKPSITRSKRPALDTVTNRPTKRAARSTAPRAPVPSAADVARTFGPQYRTRADRTRVADVSVTVDENLGHSGLRRSGRFLNSVSN